MKPLTLLIISLICSSVLSLKERKSYIHHDENELPRKVKNPTPTKPADQLPTNFFWNDVDGVNYLTLVRNHHIPNYCGGCYAFASTSVLSDRIKIARGAQWPDILISPQVVLSCTANRGCHGGSPAVVFQYVHDFGITDESCSSYRALGHENGAPCTDEIKCQVCDLKGECRVPDSYPVYYVEEFGHIKGEKAMLNEVYHRGPIACSLDANYIETYTGGIFSEPTPKIEFNHVVEIVGFGEENGVPYWLAKNSWGSFWGEQGFFRVLRGKNTLGLESTCYWAVPKDTWTNDVRNYTTPKNKKETTGGFLDILDRGGKGCVKIDPQYERFYRTSKSGNVPAWTSVQVQDLPRSWDWRNVNGVNFVSWIKSQNSPKACAACWAEAATSALADRIMIQRNTTFPEVALSVQAVINCQGGGDCNGGDPIGAYEFAFSHGIPEDSCQNYQGKNPDVFECSGLQICKNCDPPAPFKNGTDPAICQAIQKYNNWKVSDYGTLSGIEDMKRAIWTEGPIACGIQSTKRFEEYTDGVFSQYLLTAGHNHQVAIVGWDIGEDGVEYWIARNSWGSYWGELGFFRIQTGKNNLGIEKECIWGTPLLEEKQPQEEMITVEF